MDTLRDWLTEHPPADERFTQTVAGVALRVQGGEDLRFAVRELLDEFALRGRDDLRARALADEPATVDPHVDAYLGADHMWFPGVARGVPPTRDRGALTRV